MGDNFERWVGRNFILLNAGSVCVCICMRKVWYVKFLICQIRLLYIQGVCLGVKMRIFASYLLFFKPQFLCYTFIL